ncbi:MAG TPA: hypothetical protein PL090_08285, partial [Syntrophales bacterium]|nr:hypothetical protein [Syntrophales bacterium]
PIISPFHRHPQVSQPENVFLEVLMKPLFAAMADPDISHPGDVIEGDMGDILPGIFEKGNSSHEDDKNICRLHGQIPDSFPLASRVDESEPGSVIHGKGRVTTAAEIGRGC